MGSSATTLCRCFLNKSSEFAIDRPAPTTAFESEAATLRLCAQSESKTANRWNGSSHARNSYCTRLARKPPRTVETAQGSQLTCVYKGHFPFLPFLLFSLAQYLRLVQFTKRITLAFRTCCHIILNSTIFTLPGTALIISYSLLRYSLGVQRFLNCSSRELRRFLISTIASLLGQVVKDTGQPLHKPYQFHGNPFGNPLLRYLVTMFSAWIITA